MIPALLPYLIPLGLAMTGVGASILAGALTGHRSGGERLSGVGILIGTLSGWLWVRWPLQSIHSLDWVLIGAAAATVAGMVIDGINLKKPRVTLAASAVVALAVAWGVSVVLASTEDLGPTWALAAWGLGGAYWVMLLWRMARTGADPTHGLAGLTGLFLGLVGVAWAVEAWVVRDLALAALCALAGWLVWTLLARVPFTQTARLAASGLAVCLGLGLALTTPETLPGLAVAALAPLADGTAARIRLPKGRVDRVVRPLLVAGLALLPLPIAVAMALVSAGMPAL